MDFVIMPASWISFGGLGFGSSGDVGGLDKLCDFGAREFGGCWGVRKIRHVFGLGPF